MRRRHLPQVIERAAEREDWPVARIAAMLRECDRDAVAEALAQALAARLKRASQAESEIVRLLQLAKVANSALLRPAVCRLLERPAPAQVVAAALAALWHPEDAEHARRALGHPEWFVRVAAVRALDRIGGPEDRERLVALLSDSSWWVRYRTAQTLARLPGITRQALEKMLSESSDRFAADMLAQVLSERDAR
ncbi:MAG: HEAT repeat domain-containing protein [Burkholderiales bacterium]|nr:HEAT repeat domain-containing protein [Burkholderiales bacterium]